MPDRPWQGDACGLVDEYRAGRRSPLEELNATLDAISTSQLNAWGHLDAEGAQAAAAAADVSKPFGGVPIGVKELDAVAGWPDTGASTVFRDRRASHTSTMVNRATRDGGAVLVGQTTSSEFGMVNLTRTHLHGATHNPWRRGTTPGGSSGGSAAAVAGGIVTLATGGDGGGSIRIPAGFTGLVGLKATYGRIPRGPAEPLGNLTTTLGCLARSVRDVARWFDVCNGHESRDPLSLPRVSGWEAGLGTRETSGLRAIVVRDWGGAHVADASWAVIEEAATWLTGAAGLRRRDVDTTLPRLGAAWSLTGSVMLAWELREHLPGALEQLTPEGRAAMQWVDRYGAEARGKFEARRVALNERMAAIFGDVDFVITASNPDVAFAAEGPLPSVFGGVEAGLGNNGALTFPANVYGCPAISVPVGAVDGLPVGMQIVAPHYREPYLLDLARLVERERPWPLVAPSH